MFVMTVDQRRSRHDIDRVDQLRELLHGTGLVREFERTAGDEVQAVADDPSEVARASIALLADGHWSIGVGIGDVDEPLPRSTRAGRGPAFIAAREAVDAAKGKRIPIAIRGGAQPWATHAQTAARLFGDVVSGRSVEGVEAIAAVREAGSQVLAAHELGISPQAVSQRLRAARWDIEAPAHDLLADLLAEATR